MKKGTVLLMILILLSLSFKGFSQVNQQDSIKFSYEDVQKIADLIFDNEYLKDMNKSLYQENDILSKDRDAAYKGLGNAKTVIVLKDSMLFNYKVGLNQCDSTNSVLVKENKLYKNISIGEGILIVILALIAL